MSTKGPPYLNALFGTGPSTAADASEHAHAVLAPSSIDAKMTARVIEFGGLDSIIAASVHQKRATYLAAVVRQGTNGPLFVGADFLWTLCFSHLPLDLFDLLDLLAQFGDLLPSSAISALSRGSRPASGRAWASAAACSA